MSYSSMPLIIPILAAGYLLSIYVLLVLVQRTNLWKRAVFWRRSEKS